MSTELDTKSDEELMKAHQAGHKEAFTIIYDRHKSDLCGFVSRRLLGHWTQDVEDIVQIVFTQLHETRQRFDPEKRLIPYLYRIAEHWIIDYKRYQSRGKRDDRRKIVHVDEKIADPAGSRGEAAARVVAILEELPADEAKAVWLIDIENHTAQSAADSLGVTLTKMQWRYRQAWIHLREIAAHV